MIADGSCGMLSQHLKKIINSLPYLNVIASDPLLLQRAQKGAALRQQALFFLIVFSCGNARFRFRFCNEILITGSFEFQRQLLIKKV